MNRFKLIEPIVILDFDVDEETAADKFFSSKTFTKLSDETSKLYKKTWQEIYELLKHELK